MPSEKGMELNWHQLNVRVQGNGGVKDDHPGFWLGWLLDSKNKKMSCMYWFLREIFVAELLGDRNQVLGRSVWNSGEIWLVGRLVYCQLIRGPWSQGDRWGSPRRAKRLGEGRQSRTELMRTLKGPRVLCRLREESKGTRQGERRNIGRPAGGGNICRSWMEPGQGGTWKLRQSSLGWVLRNQRAITGSYIYSFILQMCIEHLGSWVKWNPLRLCFKMSKVKRQRWRQP